MRAMRRIPGLASRSWWGNERWYVGLFLGVLLTSWMGTTWAITMQEATGPEQGLIIAVDVSLSMQKKLPAVKRAVQALVDGLDLQRQYRLVLVRFGTTVEQVVDLDLDDEVARGVLRSAVQALRADQRWTHFDDLATYLTHKVASLSGMRVSALLYSDGLCSLQPRSGKHCIDLTTLGTLIPFHDFNLYMIRITNTPKVEKPPDTLPGAIDRMHVIEGKLEALTDITQGILQRIEEAALRHTPEQPTPSYEELIPSDPLNLPGIVRPEAGEASIAPPSVPQEPSTDQPPRLPSAGYLSILPPWLLIICVLAAAGGTGAVLWSVLRFRPFALVVSLDGKTHEIPIDAVPAEVRVGPTMWYDISEATLPASFQVLVARRALYLSVPGQWKVTSHETTLLPVQQEGAMVEYGLAFGELLRLETPTGQHYLVMERQVLNASVEGDEEIQESSPLDLLGVR